MQDGLGDTIRVSLTEPPELEIDPCRRLAQLASWAPFEEKHIRYFDFQRRIGQFPLQKEGDEVDYGGILHRDGSVLMSVSLDQLKNTWSIEVEPYSDCLMFDGGGMDDWVRRKQIDLKKKIEMWDGGGTGG
ncbi:4-hydroxy-3-methylbut-2-en-1-yl diphosphate synthase (ferredoxin) protein [Thalictrum thalictroides]|uniref:4-hydroxy-3-methylbut-2-en-1-yl diphosphate synthase (Ferredoxin) protein n=1 Tax=Thalictrum thalictroides TaxID=46969 RepID=A0A7J6WGF9_THATH|nr:4-hydroxy-3-methylbut-2-en-1-yl diphosphate synthase (ferredoxin) protein [Thalictrum thalictroides]